VRENFQRPYGARDDLPLFPALNAPGYYQTPLRGANRSVVVPPRRPKSSSHAHTKAHNLFATRCGTSGTRALPGLVGARPAFWTGRSLRNQNRRQKRRTGVSASRESKAGPSTTLASLRSGRDDNG